MLPTNQYIAPRPLEVSNVGNRQLIHFVGSGAKLFTAFMMGLTIRTLLINDIFDRDQPSKLTFSTHNELGGESPSFSNDFNVSINSIDIEDGSVLITGIAGFIGMSTAMQLSSKLNRSEVIGIDTFNDYYDIELKRAREQRLIQHGVRVIHGDVCDGQLLADILREHKVHTVLHLAAQAGVRYSREHPEEYWRNNVQCTETLLEAIGQNESSPRVRVVYASSSSVYGSGKSSSWFPFGHHDPLPFKEADSLDPQSVYAETKVKMEELAQIASIEHELSIVGLRFFTVYGPFGRPDMALWNFTEQFMAGKPVSLYNRGDMKRDFTFIDDIVDGIVAALNYVHSLEPKQHELFNLGKGNVRKLHEFVDIVRSDLVRSDSQRNEAMKDLIVNIDRPGGESLFTSADLTKSRGVLHFAPRIELEEGIPRFMDWYRDQWVDHKNRRENIKYLLISSFYVNRIDPQRGSNDPKNPNSFNGDTAKYIGYIGDWYWSFKKVATDFNATDIVIIHNGLPLGVMAHFPEITFLDYSGNQAMRSRESVNDIRYFHYQQYLNETKSLNRYQMIVTTDLHDVHFGRDPFEYLESALEINSTTLNIGHEQTKKDSRKRRGDFEEWVTNRMNKCSGDLAEDTMKWIKSNLEMAPNPGIIGGRPEIVRRLFDEMVSQMERLAPPESNCNFGIFSSSLFRLCVKDKQCHINNDVVFHSVFKMNQKTGHVVYHKRVRRLASGSNVLLI